MPLLRAAEELFREMFLRPSVSSSCEKRKYVLHYRSFPDTGIEITNLFATEDQAAVEFIGRGTNTGPLHMPTGDVPPTGRAVEMRFCDVYRVSNGKIVSYRSYYPRDAQRDTSKRAIKL